MSLDSVRCLSVLHFFFHWAIFLGHWQNDWDRKKIGNKMEDMKSRRQFSPVHFIQEQYIQGSPKSVVRLYFQGVESSPMHSSSGGHILFYFFSLNPTQLLLASCLRDCDCATKCLISRCLFRLPEPLESIHTSSIVVDSENCSLW